MCLMVRFMRSTKDVLMVFIPKLFRRANMALVDPKTTLVLTEIIRGYKDEPISICFLKRFVADDEINKNVGNFSKSPGIFKGYGNKPPGKENRFSSASNALNSWLVRFLYEMAGCPRSAVLLALRSKLIESIGRLPGLFEKLRMLSRRFNSLMRRTPKRSPLLAAARAA
jgi:hypothetical protein